MSKTFVEILNEGQLPTSGEHLLLPLMDIKSGFFIEDESTFFDYKREFPHSFTDDYAGGIFKSIIAFHNTHGGFIIFGVHDTARTPSHNHVAVRLEKLNTFIREKFSSPIECLYKKYDLADFGIPIINGVVDVLLIPKRSTNLPPVSINSTIGKTRAKVPYLRKGPESLSIVSEDIPFVFSSREIIRTSEPQNEASIDAFLPPSPSTLHKFVGRVAMLEKLWSWAFSREARMFLWGGGGSGKSTLAYEFLTLLADYSAGEPVDRGKPISKIMYFSAKKRELNTLTGKVMPKTSYDFENKDELFKSILIFSEYFSEDDVNSYSDQKIQDCLDDLFNTENILLCIDDIDTLITDGLDGGMEELFSAVSRSRKGSKLLYTMRNRPSFAAVRNAVEVTGLDANGEYDEFVTTCCEQFGVPMPTDNILHGRLKTTTGTRPLIIETIIGLRRSCSGYEEAVNAYEGEAGDEPRRYLFNREYRVLSGVKPRTVLCMLSLLNQPVTTDELQYLTRIEMDSLRSAIGEIRDMFLDYKVGDGGDETKFAISEELRRYVLGKSQELNNFERLKNTALNYQSTRIGKNIEVDKMWAACLRHIANNDPESAYDVVYRPLEDYEPDVVAHPRFRELRGLVAARQRKPNIELLREELSIAAGLDVLDFRNIRLWFHLECQNESLKKARDVCDIVLKKQTRKGVFAYPKNIRAEFLSRKGFSHFMSYRELLHPAYEKAMDELFESAWCNSRALAMGLSVSRLDCSKFEDGLRTSLSVLLDEALRNEDEQIFFKFIYDAMEKDNTCLDPLEDVLRAFRISLINAQERSSQDRRKGLLSRFRSKIKNANSSFSDPAVAKRVLDQVERLISDI